MRVQELTHIHALPPRARLPSEGAHEWVVVPCDACAVIMARGVLQVSRQ